VNAVSVVENSSVNRNVSRTEFLDALRRLGVANHSLVVVISDLAAFGDLETSAQDATALRGYIECFQEIMSPYGTLVVPTFTYVRGGPGSAYVHEQTPSETGVLTEYLRSLPDSRRSLHPVFSFVAYGERKDELCDNASAHSYAGNSLPHRLIEANALVIGIGRSPHRGSFLIHVGEYFAGVPYRYTKELSIPVIKNGQNVARAFYHYVKYADSDIVWDTNRLVERLDAGGYLTFEPLGLSGIWAYRAKDLFTTTLNLLNRNVYGLLERPPTKTPWKR